MTNQTIFANLKSKETSLIGASIQFMVMNDQTVDKFLNGSASVGLFVLGAVGTGALTIGSIYFYNFLYSKPVPVPIVKVTDTPPVKEDIFVKVTPEQLIEYKEKIVPRIDVHSNKLLDNYNVFLEKMKSLQDVLDKYQDIVKDPYFKELLSRRFKLPDGYPEKFFESIQYKMDVIRHLGESLKQIGLSEYSKFLKELDSLNIPSIDTTNDLLNNGSAEYIFQYIPKCIFQYVPHYTLFATAIIVPHLKNVSTFLVDLPLPFMGG